MHHHTVAPPPSQEAYHSQQQPPSEAMHRPCPTITDEKEMGHTRPHRSNATPPPATSWKPVDSDDATPVNTVKPTSATSSCHVRAAPMLGLRKPLHTTQQAPPTSTDDDDHTP
ncbi:hypothetical protein BDK51DRAFT_43138 [Blyttiomyces helicus]|uniref:Uncharacterized protein n=1 Tax=Blyttiomyces helicus TaxID=388810 RepID=A0A4P9W9M5_9FUNG|nr:hypothetical protein BDK51DRAFT_43138 [Blyttiomyces helicus]|eukprot:RKO88882.1 hypothetical protein BDK51DRAFT_43138 [Blyttiomyces helicus]